jgi:ATP-dependent Lon protease
MAELQKERREEEKLPATLPAIAIRDVVMFPHMALPLSVDRPRSVAAIEQGLKAGRRVLALTQKKPQVNEPETGDLYQYGVLSEVAQSLKLPDGTMRVFLQGLRRARVKSLTAEGESGAFIAEVEYPEEKPEKGPEVTALMRHTLEIFEQYVKLGTRIPGDSVSLLAQVEDPSRLADTIASNVPFNPPERQDLLETESAQGRLEKLLKMLAKEIEILDIEQKIHSRVKSQIEKSQKEYYLNEQMKAIQKELHQKDDLAKEVDELRKKVKQAKMSKEAEAAADKELQRLSRMAPFSPESTVSRT